MCWPRGMPRCCRAGKHHAAHSSYRRSGADGRGVSRVAKPSRSDACGRRLLARSGSRTSASMRTGIDALWPIDRKSFMRIRFRRPMRSRRTIPLTWTGRSIVKAGSQLHARWVNAGRPRSRNDPDRRYRATAWRASPRTRDEGHTDTRLRDRLPQLMLCGSAAGVSGRSSTRPQQAGWATELTLQ
jgi:hypothetical protein